MKVENQTYTTSPKPPMNKIIEAEQPEYPDQVALDEAQMWASFNGRFTACERAVPTLEPGQYNIGSTDSGIIFTKHTVTTDKLFVLPDSASDEIIRGIELFWEKEEHFRELEFLWKRGIMLYGPPGSGKCLGLGTPVLMFDGTIKAVENIVVGDQLMGDDSTPRTVLSLARGQEQLYRVQQLKGDDYVVNESHILSLKRATIQKDKNKTESPDYVDISVKDYLTQTNDFKKEYFGYKVPVTYQSDGIPTKLTQKQSQQINNPLHTSITLEKLEIGDYYGFEIDGNKRFLLGDCTVTHNTSTLQQISQRIVDRGGIAFYVDHPSLGAAGLELFRRIEPDRPVLVMLEDIDAIICNNGESSLLSLLDGELQIDNVVFIATTNYPERLDKRIMNRPSRFDVVKMIGMPSDEARAIYLSNVSETLRNDKETLEKWVSLTKGYSIAHLKELLVSVEVFEVSLEDTVNRLNTMIDTRVSSENDEKRKEFGFYE